MSSPPPFEQFVTFVYCRDIDAAARFYGELLGLPLVLDQGGCRIYRVAAEAFIGICTRPDREPPSRDAWNVLLTFVTDEVDAWWAHLAAHDVEGVQPPKQNDEYQIRHCFVRDPAGYVVEIQQFLDPGWPRPHSSGA